MPNFVQREPIARRNRTIDRQRSEPITEAIRVATLASGSVLDREGVPLTYVTDAAVPGQEFVAPATGTSADVFAGIAISDSSLFTKKAEAQTINVPAGGAGPFAVPLLFTPLASSQLLVNAGTGIALVLGGGSDYTISGGVVTFTAAYQAAHAGQVINVFYTRSIAQNDLNNLGGQNPINAIFGSTAGLVERTSEGKWFTMAYDTSQAYAVNGQLYTGADQFTSAATSTVKAGRCIKTPLIGDPYLGVDFQPGFI